MQECQNARYNVAKTFAGSIATTGVVIYLSMGCVHLIGWMLALGISVLVT